MLCTIDNNSLVSKYKNINIALSQQHQDTHLVQYTVEPTTILKYEVRVGILNLFFKNYESLT